VQTQDRTQRYFLKKWRKTRGIKPQGGNVQLSIHGDKVDEELKNNRLMPFRNVAEIKYQIDAHLLMSYFLFFRSNSGAMLAQKQKI